MKTRSDTQKTNVSVDFKVKQSIREHPCGNCGESCLVYFVEGVNHITAPDADLLWLIGFSEIADSKKGKVLCRKCLFDFDD